MLTINHEYRMDMIWHHAVLDDLYVLVVNIQSSQVGIGVAPTGNTSTLWVTISPKIGVRLCVQMVTKDSPREA